MCVCWESLAPVFNAIEHSGHQRLFQEVIRGIMEPRLQRFTAALLLFKVCCLWSAQCLSVHFSNPQHVYVIRGQHLLLQAQIQRLDTEHVFKVTWERSEKASGKRSTLAEFPLKESDGRVSLENQGATLRIRDYQLADAGLYTVTVTDTAGQRRTAQTTVQEYLAVHHVSVMLNVSHSVLHCMESWGTEPTYKWLHDSVQLTEKLGHVSTDGASLQVSGSFCGRFTCVVSNRQGHSSASYTAEPCDNSNRSTTAAIVFLLLLLTIVAAFLAFILWRRRRHGANRPQRLREPYEEHL